MGSTTLRAIIVITIIINMIATITGIITRAIIAAYQFFFYIIAFNIHNSHNNYNAYQIYFEENLFFK